VGRVRPANDNGDRRFSYMLVGHERAAVVVPQGEPPGGIAAVAG
jgi:hypothetical protein